MKTKKYFKPVTLGFGIISALFVPATLFSATQPLVEQISVKAQNDTQKVGNLQELETALLDSSVATIILTDDIDVSDLSDPITITNKNIYKKIDGQNHRIFNDSNDDVTLFTFDKIESEFFFNFKIENVVFDNVNGIIDSFDGDSIHQVQFSFSNLVFENVSDTNNPSLSPFINQLNVENTDDKLLLYYDDIVFRNNNFNFTENAYASNDYSLLGNLKLNNLANLELIYQNILIEDNYFSLESDQDNGLSESLLNSVESTNLNNVEANLDHFIVQNNHFIDTNDTYSPDLSLIKSNSDSLPITYDQLLFLNNEWVNTNGVLFDGFKRENITNLNQELFILNDDIDFETFDFYLTNSDILNLNEYIYGELPTFESNIVNHLESTFNSNDIFKFTYEEKHLVKFESEFLSLKDLKYNIDKNDNVKSLKFSFDVVSIDYRYQKPISRIELFMDDELLTTSNNFSQNDNNLDVIFAFNDELTVEALQTSNFSLRVYNDSSIRDTSFLEYVIDRNELDTLLSQITPTTPMQGWAIALIVIFSLIFVIFLLLIVLYFIKRKNDDKLTNFNKSNSKPNKTKKPTKKTSFKKPGFTKTKKPLTNPNYQQPLENDYDYDADYDYSNYDGYYQDDYEQNQAYYDQDYSAQSNDGHSAKVDYASETMNDDYNHLSNKQQDVAKKSATIIEPKTKKQSRAIILKDKERKIKTKDSSKNSKKKNSLSLKSTFFNKKKITATKNSIFDDIEEREKDNQKVLKEYLNEDDLHRDDSLHNIKNLINDTKNNSDDYLNFG